MILKISKSQLCLHLIAILTVSLIAGTSFVLLSRLHVREPINGLYLSNIGRGKLATENLVQINSALSSGKTAVILGSSELATPESHYIPYNFLPKTLHVPVLAYGHAHFQSFGQYGLLSANIDALTDQTKLVLVLSPGWFDTQSIPTAAFIEHFQPQVLKRLFFMPEAHKLVEEYILKHEGEFKNISPTQKAFLDITYFFTMVNLAAKEGVFSLKTRLNSIIADSGRTLSFGSYPTMVMPSATQWKEHEMLAQLSETGRMRHNQRWVRDEYYEQLLKNLPPEGKTYFSGKVDTNPELAMLERTLQLLKEKRVRALVVFQTLNPHVYKDAGKAKAIADKVFTLVNKAGMQFYDMTDEPVYIPGTMRDGMHTGELGWMKIDRRIMEYMVQQ